MHTCMQQYTNLWVDAVADPEAKEREILQVPKLQSMYQHFTAAKKTPAQTLQGHRQPGGV